MDIRRKEMAGEGWPPLVSVVIPVYNAQPYLKQCMESVIGQTYRNLEIILVNDGSTDGSSGLCNSYAYTDQRVRVIHKENEGLVRARKTGIASAKGDYITYVDADDWIDPEAYETVIGRMEQWRPDMVFYGLVEEYEGHSVKRVNIPAEGYYQREALRGEICPAMLCGEIFFQSGVLPNLVCKLIKRELAEQVQQQVNDEIRMGEDADCTSQLLLQAENVQFIKYTPYHYRKRPDSMVGSVVKFSQIRSLYQDLRDAFGKCADRETLMPQLYRYMLFVMLLKATDCFTGCKAFERHFAAKRIVLYGAGGFGQALYRMFVERRTGQVCLWVDRDYQAYRKLGLNVSMPEKMMERAFDHVFIAVLDTDVCKEIEESLLEMGISAEKISYIEFNEKFRERVLAVLEDG